MADTRLSDLSAAGALSASDLFYVVQTPGSGGEKATGTQLLTLVGTTYLAKAGGTMTGALTLPAGSAAAPSLLFTGAGANTGVYTEGLNNISFSVAGIRAAYVNNGTFWAEGAFGLGLINSSAGFYFGSDYALQLRRDAAATLAQRNGTNAQTLRVYATYTSGSVYERLSLSTTATTGATIAVETLGATADLDLTFTPAGTGKVRFGTHSAIAAETVTGYITVKDSGGTTRKLAVVS